MENYFKKRVAKSYLLGTALALICGLASGCGSGQAGQEGPPVTDAQREQVRATGTVLPPPSQPDTQRHTRDAAPQ